MQSRTNTGKSVKKELVIESPRHYKNAAVAAETELEAESPAPEPVSGPPARLTKQYQQDALVFTNIILYAFSDVFRDIEVGKFGSKIPCSFLWIYL